jgi:hypothetical protein
MAQSKDKVSYMVHNVCIHQPCNNSSERESSVFLSFDQRLEEENPFPIRSQRRRQQRAEVEIVFCDRKTAISRSAIQKRGNVSRFVYTIARAVSQDGTEEQPVGTACWVG